MKKPLIIAVDFDGTIVYHDFPHIKLAVPGAIETLGALSKDPNVRIILWTMRSGRSLYEAVEFCKTVGIDLWGFNRNPEQSSWSLSPKAYAQIYIDDAALGCPLIFDPTRHSRAFVDWEAVRRYLEPIIQKLHE